jgi:hypothetical protein
MTNTRFSVKVAGVVLASLIGMGNCGLAGAAEPVASPKAGSATGSAAAAAAAPFSDKELLLLEDRFFSRQYANDPIEKRLERIELLVFASTQDGTNEERLARLKKTLADRVAAKPPAQTQPASPTKSEDAKGKDSTAAAPTTAKKPESSSQYPVLNTLEWRALKKTFPAESLDLRLQRLETKLFGQDSPAMAYVDRIDRLKRTLGIGVTAVEPTTIGPRGPMPKARPRGDSSDTFGWSTPNFPSQRELMPRFGDSPMNTPNFMNKDMMQTFNQLFQQMNKQLQEMDKMPGGGWSLEPLDPEDGVQPETGKKPKNINPLPSNQDPRQMLPPIFRFPLQEEKLPAYADPNSI